MFAYPSILIKAPVILMFVNVLSAIMTVEFLKFLILMMLTNCK
jgi:hypothetical protein